MTYLGAVWPVLSGAMTDPAALGRSASTIGTAVAVAGTSFDADLGSAEVAGRLKTALAGYVKIKFQAETPDQQPARAVMQKFDAIGLPTYVILRPRR